MADMHDWRRAAATRRIDVAQLQVEILRHAERVLPGGVACTKVSVDVALRQPGVLDRSTRDLGVELRYGFVGRLAQGVFVRAHDAGVSATAHPLLFMSIPRG